MDGIGRRVLIVEDEMMVAMLVEDMVRDLGHQVVGPAMTLNAALTLATEAAVDYAILDMNLGHGVLSTPVAEALAARGIPFMFATGYGSKVVIDGFGEAPVLNKPFMAADLARVLGGLLGQAPPAA